MVIIGKAFLRLTIKPKQLLRPTFLVAQSELHIAILNLSHSTTCKVEQKHRKTSQEELISSNIKQKSGE